MKNGLILLTLFLLALLTTMIIPTTASTSEYVLTAIVQGPVIASVEFSNGTVIGIPVGNTTIHFANYLLVHAFVPNGYVLFVNGTRYGFEYNAKVNTSETLYLKAVPVFDRVTINIIGKGQIEVALGNGTTMTLDHSASFLVLGESFIAIASNQSFDVNNDGVYTKFYGAEIIRNTTLNINFNPQTPPSNLVKINLEIYGQGSLNATIENISATGVLYAYLALYTFNKSAAFYAPINTTLWLFSSTEFGVNGQLANKTGAVYSYYYYVNGNATLTVSFTNVTTTQTTTSPPPTTTTTVTQTTTTATTQTTTSTVAITSTLTTTSTTTTSSSSSSSVIYIALVIVVVAIAFLAYFMLKRKK